MESEQHHYELRSRSRSRSHTPMVPNRPQQEPEMTERHYDLRNWSRERSRTPGEVTSSRRSGSRSLTGSIKTQEKNMETIEENKEGSVTESLTDNQSTKSESSVVTTKKTERRSERQRAKRQIFVNGQSENKEDASDKAEPRHRSVTPRRVLTSDYSSEEGEREDPPSRPGSAYEIYKQAGEWWNVFPKTDYTYSPTSQCRYEIAPGIIAMPNMSRRSIHTNSNGNTVCQTSHRNLSQASRGTTESGISDMDTVDLKETASLIHSFEDNCDMSRAGMSNSTAKTTFYKKTHVKEQYTSHKEVIYSNPRYSSSFRSSYLSWANTPIGKYDTSHADSDTDLDDTYVKSSVKTNQSWRVVQWFTYFTTFIVTCFRKTVEFFKFKTNRKRQYYVSQAYRSSNESKWSSLWQTLDRYTHNMYFFFVKMLVLDAWLLSRLTGVRKWLQGKGPRILWITLLPLLLLFGAYIAQRHYFTFADSLRNVQYGVIETTYHIFNNISNLMSFTFESFTKYLADLKNYFMHLLPSVNVSLPEMPPIGWNVKWKFVSGGWCIVQCLSLLSDVKTVTETAIEKSLSNVQWKDGQNKIIEKILTDNEIIKENLVNKADLVNRIEMLENRQTHQMDYLINIIRTVEDRKQSDADFRKEYDEKIISMENKLGVELKNIAYSELEVIKHEFEELRKLYSELKSCCNANAESIINQDIEKHVERILLGYFPSGISKEDLGQNLQSLLASHNREAQKILDNANVYTSDEHVRKIVKEVLRIYDADKTGQVDYALETAGGQIISTRCTQQYDIKSRAFSLYGFTLYYESNNPRTVIQGNPIQPGVCWAFQDFPGYLLIQLRSFIYVTGFTLEHVSKLILPNENMSSAPRKFNVWGLLNENDLEPVMFGEYEFTYSDESLQYFPVQNTEINKPYEYIELRIRSNHGQLNYTCLYRFRVHGRPA
ncbi:SUN domain-containing protein 1 [Trachymyrmex zeteki]|uniref:SUN domain-containing protein 1 n=1 Tax=Mycetomoellerius zeteki TaxID=64791 RepID=A0A151WG56_9HYME|nr:SUN domain-containing protein 1 [Trachymyrmex zeteki]